MNCFDLHNPPRRYCEYKYYSNNNGSDIKTRNPSRRNNANGAPNYE